MLFIGSSGNQGSLGLPTKYPQLHADGLASLKLMFHRPWLCMEAKPGARDFEDYSGINVVAGG